MTRITSTLIATVRKLTTSQAFCAITVLGCDRQTVILGNTHKIISSKYEILALMLTFMWYTTTLLST